MKKDQEASATKRRDFLRLAGIGALSSAAAASVGGTDAEAKEAGDHGRGYRETAHVKKVYELSRF